MAETPSVTKILAVLYADQVGSTAMAQALGDGAYDEVRREIEASIAAAADAHGGWLVKSTGDGALIVYESAAGAIAGAITLQSEVAAIRPRDGHRAQLRIGLAVGDVVVEVDDCFGTPVVEAARFEAAAPPGGILCTEMVKVLAGSRTDATFLEHDPVEAKGFAQPLAAFEIDWRTHELAGGLLAEDVARAERLPLAGRQRELEQLLEVYGEVAAGASRTVLVAGEPGVGKSRLVREAARRAASAGALVLDGRCDQNFGRPYQPFAEALTTFLRIVPDAAEQLGESAAELQNLLPELRQLVPDLGEPLDSDPETVRYRMFDAVAQWLVGVSRRRPVVLLLDDVHWADDGTTKLLRHLVRRADTGRLLLAATYRDTEPDEDGELAQLVRDLHRQESVHRVALQGLRVEDVAAMLDAVGREPDLAVAQRILDRTGGNAYFTGEIVLGLRDRAFGPSDIEVELPAAARDVILGRVARLSRSAQELLSLAAVFGRTASVHHLRTVRDVSLREVAADVAEAVAAGLLDEVDDPPMHVRFVHALTQSAMYSRLTAMERVVLHHDAADVIRDAAGEQDAEVSGRIARHLEATGDPDAFPEAVRRYRRAAEWARVHAADAAAARHLERAFALVEQLRPPDVRLRCEVMLELGHALRRARLAGSRDRLLEAGRIAREQGYDDLLVQAAMRSTRGFFSSAGATDEGRVELLRDALAVVPEDDLASRARLLSDLSVELTFGAPFEERLALSDEAVALARRLENREHLFHVLGMRYGTLWTATGLPQRVDLGTELRALAEELDRSHYRHVAAWSSFQTAMESGDLALADESLAMQERIAKDTPTQRSYRLIRLAVRACVAGDLAAAEAYATESYQDAEAAGEPDALAFYVGLLNNIRYHQGRLEELRQPLETAVRAAPGIPSFKGALALLHVEAGRLEDARPFVTELGAGWREIGQDLSWLLTISLTAECAAAVRDLSLCAELHEALEPFREQFVDNATNWFGSVHRFLGLLEHALGRYDDADRSFAAAIEAHADLPAPLLLARSRLGWAESLLDRPAPDRDRARSLLTQAGTAAEQHGLGTVQRRVAAALGSVEVSGA